MPIISKEDFKIKVKFEKPILALDYGEKRIGIAVSNPECTIALAKEVLKRNKIHEDIHYIKKITQEKIIQAIIVGMPYNIDGSEGPKCEVVKVFANNLLKSINLDVIFWDERFSTMSQEKILIKNDVSRKKRKTVIDKLAARAFLQDFLDYLRN